MPRPARSTGTTTTSAATRVASAGPSGVSTVDFAVGMSRSASVASSTLMRVASRRNSSGGVVLSRSWARASCTSGWLTRCSTGPRMLADDADVREIAVLLGVIESVAHDEVVLDREADVFHRHLNPAPRRLAQQTRRPQRLGVAHAEDVVQVVQRQAGVDDVFDDNDVASVERQIEVFRQLDLTGRRGALGIGGG